MKYRFAVLLLGASLFFSSRATAGDGVVGTMRLIPEDALAFICVPSIAAVDADYGRAIKDLQLQDLIAPPFNSLQAMLTQQLPLMEHVDPTGPLALVFMPAMNVFELQQKQAMILTAKNAAAMLEALGTRTDEEGNMTALLMGTPVHVATAENKVILAGSGAVAKALTKVEKSIDKKLNPQEQAGFDGLDLAIWINGDQLFTMVKPMVDGFLGPMMMQSATNPFEAKSAEMNMKQIGMLMDGTASILIGLALTDTGVGVRVGLTAKAESEFAKRMSIKSSTESLLTGLDNKGYMVAFGQTIDPEQSKAALADLDPLLDSASKPEEEGAEPLVDAKQVDELKQVIRGVAPLITGVRGTIDALTPGAGGLIGMTLIVDTADSAKFVELLTKGISLGKSILASVAKGMGEDKDEMQQLGNAIVYTPDAEEIDGGKVHHLKLDLEALDEVDEESTEDMQKVVGSDGVLLRMATAGANKVVFTFGGGAGRLSAAMKDAAGDAAPLDADAGIQSVSKNLPKRRAQVIYIAFDRILGCVQNVLRATDEEALPIEVPAINAPLAVAASGKGNAIQWDVFFPNALLLASKNAGMQMMGGGGPEPAPEGQPAPEAEPAPQGN